MVTFKHLLHPHPPGRWPLNTCCTPPARMLTLNTCCTPCPPPRMLTFKHLLPLPTPTPIPSGCWPLNTCTAVVQLWHFNCLPCRLKVISRIMPSLFISKEAASENQQSSGAVWKSRWPSWAPIPNKPTVSVDVKQHSADQWKEMDAWFCVPSSTGCYMGIGQKTFPF